MKFWTYRFPDMIQSEIQISPHDINPSIIADALPEEDVPEVLSEAEEISKLFKEYKRTGNKALRTRLAVLNQPLVPFIINKYYKTKSKDKNAREDLIQEGNIGLISAIDGFNPDLGYKFSTYSCWWIRQAVNNYLANIEPSIRIPGHVRSAYNKLIKQLKQENKDLFVEIKKQDGNDIGSFSGINQKMIDNISCAINAKHVKSLDEEFASANMSGSLSSSSSAGNSLYNRNAVENDVLFADSCGHSGDNFCSLDQKFDEKNVSFMIKKAFGKLSLRDKLLILLRFDLIEEDDVPILIKIWAKNQTGE